MGEGGYTMYTYGYLREATIAHIDLDEEEVQAMNLANRLHIFCNDAMQIICGGKPKYTYFRAKVVRHYETLVRERIGDNWNVRVINEEEEYYLKHGEWREPEDPSEPTLPVPMFLDQVDTDLWYEKRGIYRLNKQIKMPQDFIAFAATKQAWIWEIPDRMTERRDFFEGFVTGTLSGPRAGGLTPVRRRTNPEKDFAYSGSNQLVFMTEGTFLVPYKAIWFRFISGIADTQEIDMPIDIFTCIPLCVAAKCLEIDHAQKAQLKMAQFERALAAVTATDMMELKEIRASFE